VRRRATESGPGGGESFMLVKRPALVRAGLFFQTVLYCLPLFI